MSGRSLIEPVLVVGAGPVGLLLAARLAHAGVAFRLVERRDVARSGSRAIGVHPPGLAALASVGADAEVRAAGVRIEAGRAYGAAGPLGRLAFAADAPVLSVPQVASEAALDGALHRAGGRVERGVTLTGLRRGAEGRLLATLLGAEPTEVDVGLVVGCDGRDSSVRTLAGIGRRGGPYPDRYAMADVMGGAALGAEAAIHLHRDGLAESFPLPGGWRRVVVRLPDDERGNGVDDWGGEASRAGGQPAGARAPDLAVARRVCALAAARGAGVFEPDSARMTSVFGIERWLASRFVLGRVVLAGDAAHVVSPIGGQGMNLGWLDAAALADALERIVVRGASAMGPELEAYAQRRRRAAQVALWRAARNTSLGRPHSRWRAGARDALLRVALRRPWSSLLEGAFTMRGLA